MSKIDHLVTVKCVQGLRHGECCGGGACQQFAEFDLTIFDEVHKYMAPVFMRNVVACDTKHIIGISATPFSKFQSVDKSPFD